VDQDEVVAEQGVDDPSDGVVGQGAVEGLGQVGGGVVADLVPGLHGGDAERDQQVAFPGAGRYQRFRLVIAAFMQVISMLRLMERGYVTASWPFQPRRVSSRRSCRFSP